MEGDHLEDPDVDGRIILKLLSSKSGMGGRQWIDLSQDTDRWQAVLTTVMNLRVP